MIYIKSFILVDLESWLNIELPGFSLFGLSVFYNTAFDILLAVAVIFTPVLLQGLFSE